MISDSDLLMLENLTYCLSKNNPAYVFGLKAIDACKTVGEYLNQFTDDILNKLDGQSNKTYDGENSGPEWAAMIRYLKTKKEIIELKIKEATEKVICFVNPNEDGSAIVAFRGTNGGDEWKDNVEGLNQADTKYQLEAYNYIEGLNYEHVTVVGHSKGGNKAQYVAIRCDKVDRCVSYDGQGFSKEFIDKYSVEIDKNAHKISCYSLSTDFVHILMFPIPGAEQFYMNGGDDVANVGENHSPDAAFNYYQDEDGKWHVRVDGNGNVDIDFTNEDPSMTMLHNFICFFMNNASEEEMQQIVTLLGPLLKGIFGEGWSTDQIAQYLSKHEDELITFIAYFIKYIKLNDLQLEDILRVCESLGIDIYQLISKIIEEKTGVKISEAKVRTILNKIFKFGLDQLTDGNEDVIIKWLINTIGGEGGQYISSLWQKIEDKYNDINATNNTSNYTSKIRDYSSKVYNALSEAVTKFSKNTLPDVSSWSGYSGENWFGKIMLSLAINIINKYSEKVIKVNQMCERRIMVVFDDIMAVDTKYGKKFNSLISTVKTVSAQIMQ